MLNKNKKSHKIQIGKAHLLKLPRIVTMEDVLATDDVNGILEDITKVKPAIKDLIIIWMGQDGNYHFEITDETLSSTATWMLESAKLDILNEDLHE
jgi:hypothetical protein